MRTRTIGWWSVLVSISLVGACGDITGDDDDDIVDPPDAAVDDPDAPAPDASLPQGIQWSPCPYFTGGTGSDAECADVEVPVDWTQPDGDKLTLFVKRMGNPTTTGQQVWFLMGGPGGDSSGYESLGDQLLNADPTLIIYLMDHRGTGRSTRLGCPVQEGSSSPEGWLITIDEWPACAASLQTQWGANLDHFSTTEAARDLGYAIGQTRLPGQWVHIHGGSYGTFWAQRYLQIFPDQPTSVSMLGVVHPTFSFTKYNEHYELIGAEYLAQCGADSFCASKLGADPEATFRAVMGDIGGYCPEALAAGLDRATLRGFFGSQLIWGWDERTLPLAIIYRIQRCDAGDITALEYFAENMVDPLDGLRYSRLFSASIGAHIGLSDLWEAPIPTVAEGQALIDDALWAFGSTARLVMDEYWPKYAPDEYHNVFAETDVPILMINGELDPASPLYQAEPVGEHFNGPNQHFVALPGAPHTWMSPTTEGYQCGINIFFNFLTNPTADLLDCVGLIIPIEFTGTSAIASLLGTTDQWENPSTAAAVTPDAATLERVRTHYARFLRGEF